MPQFRIALLLALVALCGVWPASAAATAISPSSVYRVAGDGGSGGDVGLYSSMAQDAGGGQHIAYFDTTYHQIKIAHRATAATPWAFETVTTSSSLGQYCSMAVGPAQSVATTVTLTAGSPLVVVRSVLVVSPLLIGGTLTSGATYLIAAVDSSTATKTLTLSTPYAGATATVSVLVDFYQPTASFQSGSSVRRLHVARPSGVGGWIVDTVDGPGVGTRSTFTGFESSLALSGDGRIHVAYRDGLTTGSIQMLHGGGSTSPTVVNVLRYAVYEGGAWTIKTADPESSHGFGPRIVADSRNAPVILHRDNLNGRLMASWKDAPTSSTWTNAIIDDHNDAGLGIGAAYFAPGDQVLVVHHEQAGTSVAAFNKLMFSAGVRSAGAWQFSLHQVATGQGIGDFAGVAHGDTTGTLHVTYFESTSQTLKTQFLGAALAPTSATLVRNLDVAADVGRYCSPTIDSFSGTLFAAYYDATRRALKIASDNGATTTTAFVDGLRFGTDSAIGLTATHVVVAYYAQTEGTLHLAKWLRGDTPASPSFTDAVLDASSSDVGASVRLAIDGNDTIYLAYVDRANKSLRGAMVFADGSTQAGTIASPALDGVLVGEYCGIALNRAVPANRLGVVFYVTATDPAFSGEPTLYFKQATSLPATNPGSYSLAFTGGAATNTQTRIGRYCSAAYDSSNTLHIAFLNDATLQPAYTSVNAAGGLSGSQDIVSSFFDHGGLETSIAINPATNRPAIAYYNITGASLKCAELVSGAWVVGSVDSGGDTGHAPVLRFDNVRKLARIVYWNQTTGELRLATHSTFGGAVSDESWQTATLLDDSMGFHPSMAIDVDGTLALSFEQPTTGDLLTTLGAFVPFLSAASAAWLAAP